MNKLGLGNTYKDCLFIGVIIANNDPELLQRVQVRIPLMHDNTINADLPWCRRDAVDGIGQGGGASACKVPVVNSHVIVRFENGDKHHPVYMATATLTGTLNAIFQTNYPSRYGFIDPVGNQYYIDMVSGDAVFTHSSGTTLHIDKTGNVTGSNPGNMLVNIGGNATVNVTGNGILSAASWKVEGNTEFTGTVLMDSTLTVTGAAVFNGGVTSV